MCEFSYINFYIKKSEIYGSKYVSEILTHLAQQSISIRSRIAQQIRLTKNKFNLKWVFRRSNFGDVLYDKSAALWIRRIIFQIRKFYFTVFQF